MVQRWEESRKASNNLVIVCDNAPCHSRIEQGPIGTGAVSLRLTPYSPALNPMEAIWSSFKATVKRQLRIPQARGAGVGEQRMQYMEDIVQAGFRSLNDEMCVRSFQHSTTFRADVGAQLENKLFLNFMFKQYVRAYTCIIMQSIHLMNKM